MLRPLSSFVAVAALLHFPTTVSGSAENITDFTCHEWNGCMDSLDNSGIVKGGTELTVCEGKGYPFAKDVETGVCIPTGAEKFWACATNSDCGDFVALRAFKKEKSECVELGYKFGVHQNEDGITACERISEEEIDVFDEGEYSDYPPDYNSNATNATNATYVLTSNPAASPTVAHHHESPTAEGPPTVVHDDESPTAAADEIDICQDLENLPEGPFHIKFAMGGTYLFMKGANGNHKVVTADEVDGSDKFKFKVRRDDDGITKLYNVGEGQCVSARDTNENGNFLKGNECSETNKSLGLRGYSTMDACDEYVIMFNSANHERFVHSEVVADGLLGYSETVIPMWTTTQAHAKKVIFEPVDETES